MQNFKDSFFSDENQQYHCNLHGSARAGFVKKVYGILSVQLTATFLLCYLAMNSVRLQSFLLNNIGVFFFAVAATIIIPLVLACNRQLARQVPTNYVLLGVFTFCESYLVSFSCIIYDPKIVSMAALLTMGITFSLTLYAMTTKTDITYMGGLFFMIATGLFFAGLARFFIQSEFLEIMIALGGAILYGLYLIYDTQLIMGGKRGALEIDDYIFGALMIYLDVIVLFLKILKLLKTFSEDDKKKKTRR